MATLLERCTSYNFENFVDFLQRKIPLARKIETVLPLFWLLWIFEFVYCLQAASNFINSQGLENCSNNFEKFSIAQNLKRSWIFVLEDLKGGFYLLASLPVLCIFGTEFFHKCYSRLWSETFVHLMLPKIEVFHWNELVSDLTWNDSHSDFPLWFHSIFISMSLFSSILSMLLWQF